MPCVDMYKVPNAAVSPAAIARTKATHSLSEVCELVSTLLRSPPRVGAASRCVTAAVSTFALSLCAKEWHFARELPSPNAHPKGVVGLTKVLHACFSRIVNQTTATDASAAHPGANRPTDEARRGADATANGSPRLPRRDRRWCRARSTGARAPAARSAGTAGATRARGGRTVEAGDLPRPGRC